MVLFGTMVVTIICVFIEFYGFDIDHALADLMFVFLHSGDKCFVLFPDIAKHLFVAIIDLLRIEVESISEAELFFMFELEL